MRFFLRNLVLSIIITHLVWMLGISVFTPAIKYAASNVLLEVIKREQHLLMERTDDVGTFFSMLVMIVSTRHTDKRITIRAHSLMLKATFVHVDNWISCFFIRMKFSSIPISFDQANVWMY